MGEIVFLNGKFVPHDKALIHVEDRANLFADGVYEVIRYYDSKPFLMGAHLKRLKYSCEGLRLSMPYDLNYIAKQADEVVKRNGLKEALLYLQISRGKAPRNHAFPEKSDPTLFMFARPFIKNLPEYKKNGVSCITVTDKRWELCNYKTVALLANVLAKQEAVDAGCYEAILVRNGIVTEGSSSNVFVVRENQLYTHPKSGHILPGITRDVVIELAKNLDLVVSEEPFTASSMDLADEVFITSTAVEVLPVVTIDSKNVAMGVVGPVALSLDAAFQEMVKEKVFSKEASRL